MRYPEINHPISSVRATKRLWSVIDLYPLLQTLYENCDTSIYSFYLQNDTFDVKLDKDDNISVHRHIVITVNLNSKFLSFIEIIEENSHIELLINNQHCLSSGKSERNTNIFTQDQIKHIFLCLSSFTPLNSFISKP